MVDKCISDISVGFNLNGKKFKNPIDAYDSIKYDMDNNISGGFTINCSEMSYQDRLKLSRWVNSLLCERMNAKLIPTNNGFTIM